MKRTILLTVGLVLCLSSLLIGAAAAQRATNATEHKVCLPFIFKGNADYNDGDPKGRITNFHMSNSCDGPAMTHFPSGIDTVYVIFNYAYMEYEPIRIVVKGYGGTVLYDQRKIYVGAGTECLEIPGPFPDFDYYVTVMYVTVRGVEGPSWTIDWSVGD